MEKDVSTSGVENRLNKFVGLTVLVLSVVMALGKIKDDNIVQAMQVTKAQVVDTWNEYQAKKIKLHMTEQSITFLKLLPDNKQTPSTISKLEQEVQRYTLEAKNLKQSAEEFDKQYDKLGFRDDQFDLADAMLSIAIALSGVVALTLQRWLLFTAWTFGAGGIIFTLSGFAGWTLHPDAIIRFLT